MPWVLVFDNMKTVVRMIAKRDKDGNPIWNRSEEMYGTERLMQFMEHMDPDLTPDEVIEAILQDVTEFVGTAEQYDDMTIVIVKKL